MTWAPLLLLLMMLGTEAEDGNSVTSMPKRRQMMTTTMIPQSQAPNYGKPKPPQNLQCVNHNRRWMRCWYDPGMQEPGMNVTYQLYYSIYLGDGFFHCPTEGRYSCSWEERQDKDSFQDRKTYHILIYAINWFGGSNSTLYARVDTKTIVKPYRVREVTVGAHTSNTISVSWSSPFDSKIRELKYRARYSRNCDSQTGLTLVFDGQVEERLNSSMEPGLTLTGLTPNTHYCISLQAHPAHSRGFWSDPLTISAKTLTDVPSALPAVINHGFRLQPIPDNPSHVLVTVFWKKLDPVSVNGVLTLYNVTLTEVEMNKIINNTATKTIMLPPDTQPLKYTQRLGIDHSYAFSVAAASDRGFNNSLEKRPIIISPSISTVHPPVGVVAFLLNDSAVLVNWTQSSAADEYAVFWCYYKLPGQCDEGVGWTVYGGHQHGAILRPDSRAVMYAVSTHENGVYSGMSNWTRCLYIYHQKAVAPSEVRLSNYQEAASLSVQWHGVDCSSKVYVTHFIISFCQADRHNTCTGRAQNLTVDRWRTKYTVRELEADKAYRMWMYSVAPSGVSEASNVVHGLVKYSGLPSSHIVLMVIGGIFALVLIAGFQIAVISKIRYLKDKHKMTIRVPPKINMGYQNKITIDIEEITVDSPDLHTGDATADKLCMNQDMTLELSRHPSNTEVCHFDSTAINLQNDAKSWIDLKRGDQNAINKFEKKSKELCNSLKKCCIQRELHQLHNNEHYQKLAINRVPPLEDASQQNFHTTQPDVDRNSIGHEPWTAFSLLNTNNSNCHVRIVSVHHCSSVGKAGLNTYVALEELDGEPHKGSNT